MLRLLASGFALALLLNPVTADDKKDEKNKAPSWERESNGVDLRFEFGKDTLKLMAFNGENGAIVSCKTTTDKDGVVKATVTAVEEKGDFPAKPKVGFEFSFKWKADGDKANLSDLKGEGLDDVKAILEGEYKKKK
jgi:hypothetical protein